MKKQQFTEKESSQYEPMGVWEDPVTRGALRLKVKWRVSSFFLGWQ